MLSLYQWKEIFIHIQEILHLIKYHHSYHSCISIALYYFHFHVKLLRFVICCVCQVQFSNEFYKLKLFIMPKYWNISIKSNLILILNFTSLQCKFVLDSSSRFDIAHHHQWTNLFVVRCFHEYLLCWRSISEIFNIQLQHSGSCNLPNHQTLSP